MPNGDSESFVEPAHDGTARAPASGEPTDDGTAPLPLELRVSDSLPTDIETATYNLSLDLQDSKPTSERSLFETVCHDEQKTAPQSSKTAIPTTRFEVLSEHARGGLGVVYLAIDTEFEREVAYKKIRPDRGDSAEYQFKFAREAKLTGQLEHPCIVPVYASGKDSTGTPFYAMRFIRGKDLRLRIHEFHAALKSKSLPYDGPELRSLLRRFSEVLNAIAYAHSKGVLHRDLKPSNVMLGDHGETFVVDWGLAKRFSDESVSGASSGTSTTESEPEHISLESPTTDGSFLGSPAYAAPEQALGQLSQVGTWSDIYSLGAMLFHLLTGVTPVSGKSMSEILAKINEGKIPSPESVVSTIPRRLALICKKAMSRDPQQRFRTATEMKDEIELWLDDQPSCLFKETWLSKFARWVRKHPAIVASAAASLSLALVASVIVLKVSGAYQSQLTEKVQQITKTSSELEASNAAIQAQAREFRIKTAQRDLQLGKQAYASGQNRIAISSLQSAIDLSAEEPALQRKMLKESWALVSDFQRSSPIYTGPIEPQELSVSTTSLINFAYQKKQLWDLKDNVPREEFLGEPVANQIIRFSTNGVIAVSQSRSNHQIKVISLTPTESPIGLPIQERGEVHLAVSNSGRVVICRPTWYQNLSMVDPTAGNTPKEVSSADCLSIWRLEDSGDWSETVICPQLFAKPLEGFKGSISDIVVNEQATRIGVLLSDPSTSIFQLWDVTKLDSPMATTHLDSSIFDQLRFCNDESRILIQANADLKVFDATTGEQVSSLPHDVSILNFSTVANGSLIATQCFEGKLRFWNGHSGELLRTMPIEDLMDICYSPNGMYLAIARRKGTIEIFEGPDMYLPFSNVLNHGNNLTKIVFTPDSERLMSFDDNDCMRVWNMSQVTAYPRSSLPSAEILVTSVSEVSQIPDAALLPADPPTPSAPLTPAVPLAAVMPATPAAPIAPSPVIPEATALDEPLAIEMPLVPAPAISAADAVQPPAPRVDLQHQILWGIDNWESTQFYPKSNRRLVYSYSKQAGFSIFDWSSCNLAPTPASLSSIRRFCISPNGLFLGVFNEDSHNQLISLEDYSVIADLGVSLSQCTDIAFSTDSKFMAMTFKNGTASILDCHSQIRVTPLLPHGAPVFSQAFSPAGDLYATLTIAGTLSIFGTNNYDLQSVIPIEPSGVGCLHFVADGKFIVACPDSAVNIEHPQVTIVDVATKQVVKTIDLASSPKVASHSSGKIAYVSRDTKSIQILDLIQNDTSEMIFPPSEVASEERIPLNMEFSSDGSFLVAIVSDGSLALIEPEGGVVMQKYPFLSMGVVAGLVCHPHENTFCFNDTSNIQVQRLTVSPLPSAAYISHCLALLSRREAVREPEVSEDLYRKQMALSIEMAPLSKEIVHVRAEESASSHFSRALQLLADELPTIARLHADAIPTLGSEINELYSARLNPLKQQCATLEKEIRTSELLLDRVIQGDKAALETVESMLFTFVSESESANSKIASHRAMLFEAWLMQVSLDRRKKAAEALESISEAFLGDRVFKHLALASQILACQAKEPLPSDAGFSYFEGVAFYNAFFWMSQGKNDLAKQCIDESFKELKNLPRSYPEVSTLEVFSIHRKFNSLIKLSLERLSDRISEQ